MKTARQCLGKSGFDFDAFEIKNEYSAKNILQAMEEYANQSKWISVEDRLPKTGEYVIAYNGEEQMICQYTTYQKGSIGYAKGLKQGWFEYISNRNSAIRFINITHWQPLPEKP